MKRIISLLLAVILVLSFGGVAALAAPGEKTVTAHYDMEREFHRDYKYSDHYFDGSAYNYRDDLARVSLGLAGAAGTKEFFSELAPQLGLKNVAYDYWMTHDTERDSIGVSVGTKKLKDDKGTYTLIVAPVRGSGYHQEWAGNVNVGYSGEHLGFAIARDKALDFLKGYIKDHNIKGRIKLWTVGYSRGAAVANFIGGALDDAYAADAASVNPILGEDVSLAPEDIFIYTFETVLGADETKVQDKKYDNIHNIINPSDLVTAVPFREWGFARYGVDHLTPVKGDANYDTYKAPFLEQFQQDPNILYTTYWPDLFQAWHVDVVGNVPVRFSKKDESAAKFFRDLGVALTNSFTTSRDDFVDELEPILFALLSDYGRENQDEHLDAAEQIFLKTVQANWTSLFGALLRPDQTAAQLVLDWLLDSFAEANVLTYDSKGISEALDVLLPRARTLAQKYPDETATLLSNILNIVGGHFIGSTDSWLRTLPDGYYGSHTAYSYKS